MGHLWVSRVTTDPPPGYRCPSTAELCHVWASWDNKTGTGGREPHKWWGAGIVVNVPPLGSADLPQGGAQRGCWENVRERAQPLCSLQ